MSMHNSIREIEIHEIQSEQTYIFIYETFLGSLVMKSELDIIGLSVFAIQCTHSHHV